jgi:SAM-dependent MidA family methyltransferase
VRGVIFCNELLDAFPVHRLGWDSMAQVWFEWGVAVQNEGFVWARIDESSPHYRLWNLDPAKSVSLEGSTPFPFSLLPKDFTIEICPAATEWWTRAATLLEWGRLVTIDYGLTAGERLSAERQNGTLRAYSRHHPSPSVLDRPGEQDITADVDFSALQRAGELAGLKTDALITQSQLLTQIAARIWQGEAGFGEWTERQTRQFKTLTHPEHLGRGFRVLVQSKT